MSDPTNPTYRAGEAYAITGPCSMASPCPGPDVPRDQHGQHCRWGVEATLRELGISPNVLVETPTTPLAPETLAELQRLAEAARDLPSGSDWLHGEVADGTETVAEWMDKCSANPDELRNRFRKLERDIPAVVCGTCLFREADR